MQTCPGRHRVSDSRKWYIPVGKTSRECTYCEECFEKYVKNTSQASSFTCQTNIPMCNCDCPETLRGYSLLKNNLRVMVVDAKTSQAYPLLSSLPSSEDGGTVSSELANANGVMHVVLPTCTEYHITVDLVDEAEDVFFSLESGKVGDRGIVINGGSKIYYNGLDIKGYKTGTKESFCFISRSQSDDKTLEGENVSNIIELKFVKWVRVPYVTSAESAVMRGWECKGLSKGIEEGNCTLQVGGNLSGGATVSGNTYVAHVQPRSTYDTFREQESGEVNITIQLVCTQSDEEKYLANTKYYMQKDIDMRDKLIEQRKRKENDLLACKDLVDCYTTKGLRLTDEIKDLTDSISEYDYLGSSNPLDHTIKF